MFQPLIGRSVLVLAVAILSNPATAEELARTWTSASGKFSVRAAYIAVKDNNVILMKASGHLLSVPFTKLSNADNRYVATILQQELKGAPAKVAAAPMAAPAPKPKLQKQVTPKLNVVLGEDAKLAARNDRAAEDERIANLRKEQLDIDSRMTALNTKLIEIRSRGQQLRVNGEELLGQIGTHEQELNARNDDMLAARQEENWERVQSHAPQMAAVRDRVAQMKQRYSEMNAEYSGLEQQVYGIEQQIALLQQTFLQIAEEISAATPNALP